MQTLMRLIHTLISSEKFMITGESSSVELIIFFEVEIDVWFSTFCDAKPNTKHFSDITYKHFDF